MASGEHYKAIPRTHEKSITLADTPYTLSLGYNCVKVDTTGGNVRVNLPDTNYPIDVIKTSSDAYIVTVWVGGVRIGEVAGELSKITIENAEVTKDEPWYPFDIQVGFVGVPNDGAEVVAVNKFGKRISRGSETVEAQNVINAALAAATESVTLRRGTFYASNLTIPTGISLLGCGERATYIHSKIDNAPIIILTGGVQFNKICNMSLNGRRSIFSTVTGIKLDGAKETNISDVRFSSISGSAIDLSGSGYAYVQKYDRLFFEDCGLISASKPVLNINPSAIKGATGISISDCVFEPNEYECIYIGNVEGITIQKSWFESESDRYCSDYFIVVNGSTHSYGVTIRENRFWPYWIENANAAARFVNVTNLRFVDNLVMAAPSLRATSVLNVTDCINASIDHNYFYIEIDTGVTSNIVEVLGGSCDMYKNTVAGVRSQYEIYYAPGTSGEVSRNTFTLGSFPSTVDVRRNSTYATENFGSSTGTGSEEPIPHSLTAIPVGCRAWITYKDAGGDYITEFVRFNATHIKVNLDTGIAYTWGIGAI